MSNRKFINALLVVTLGYGQLVASVHFVNHFQDKECETSFSAAFPDCGSSLHVHAHNTIADHFAHDHPVPETTDNGDAHADCAIYHAFLSLYGVMTAIAPEAGVTHQKSVYSGRTPDRIATATLKHHQIRAPPAFS